MYLEHSNNSTLSQHHQSGVGLVEVLVALIVISVGMLGIASLYVTTLQAKTTSLSRMKAVNLAYDLADRIRANPAGVANYALASTSSTSLAAPTATCTTTDCTAQDLAARDLYLWQRQAVVDTYTRLPGTVTRRVLYTAPTATTPALIEIRLQWDEQTATGLLFDLQVQI